MLIVSNCDSGGFMFEIDRRQFLKWTALTSSAYAFSSYAVPFLKDGEEVKNYNDYFDSVKWAACAVNCGSRCPLRVVVKDGRIQWIETDNEGSDEYGQHQVRACLRGRSNRYRIYNPNRITYPLKRVGKRGEGNFRRISWEEAYKEISDKMKDLKQEYGNGCFYINYGTGSLGGTLSRSWPPYSSPIARMMNLWGGHLAHYNDYSTANIADGLDHFYGGWVWDSDIANIEYSELVILFGNNMLETRMGGSSVGYSFVNALQRGRNKGTLKKLIVIDPRYTDTAAIGGAEWVPIRPATDAALVAGMAHVIIKNNLHNKEFLDRYCIGFSRNTLPDSAPTNGSYEDYIMGLGEDQTEKTPKWASEITGIPEGTIIRLAKEVALAKPAYISQGWGPQRHSNGEQLCRSIATLACMTGNVGILGGASGAREGPTGDVAPHSFPIPENPVKEVISMFLWTDAIVRGTEMTDVDDGVRGGERLTAPIKFIWNYASNCLINQHADSNKTARILEDESMCEMIVDINLVRTPSNRYADIILPDASHLEQVDFAIASGYSTDRPYVILTQGAINPVGESKNMYEFCSELSSHLGGDELRSAFTENRTAEQWLEKLWEDARVSNPSWPSYERMKEIGIYKAPRNLNPFIVFEDYINDPEANPLTTPSGKIEIYSLGIEEKQRTWNIKPGQKLTAVPEFIASRETHLDPLVEKYPLQLVGFHYKARTHSSYWENEAIRELNPQEVWINPMDAEARGIKTGDKVIMQNDFGKILSVARVTARMMPGVTGLGQGAWYKPEGDIDVGGSVNTLTSQEPTPLSKGNGQHSILIEIEKAI